MAFTLLLGFLVALPSFGIDMSLPALTAMGAALGVAAGHLAIWLAIGVAIGVAIGSSFRRKGIDCSECAARHREHETRNQRQLSQER